MVVKKTIKKDLVENKEEMKISDFFADFDEDVEVKEPTYVDVLNVEFDGLELRLNGKQYIIPSLTVSQYKKLGAMNIQTKNLDMNQQMEYITFVCLSAFRRNYKDTSKEWLETVMSPSDMANIISFVMSGMTKQDQDEQKKR